MIRRFEDGGKSPFQVSNKLLIGNHGVDMMAKLHWLLKDSVVKKLWVLLSVMPDPRVEEDSSQELEEAVKRFCKKTAGIMQQIDLALSNMVWFRVEHELAGFNPSREIIRSA